MNANTGLPVPRALVRFNAFAMLTDSEGRFAFSQVTAGRGTLQVIKPGFYRTTEPGGGNGEQVQVIQPSSPLEVRLFPEALLTGTLTGPDGGALMGVPVNALRNVFDDNGHRLMSAGLGVTNSRGEFRIPVPAGEYRLATQYIPWNESTDDAILPVVVPDSSLNSSVASYIKLHSGEEQHFDLRARTGVVHAVQISAEGVGRGFPMISARASDGSLLQIAPRRNPGSGSGSYRIELPNGSYSLTASQNTPEGMAQAQTTVTVAGKDVTGVTLRFVPVPALPVEVSVDPAATGDQGQLNLAQLGLQLGLTLENADPDTEGWASVTRPSMRRDRSLALAVPPGSYRLRARNRGAWYVKSASYSGTDLLDRNLVVAPGSSGTPIRVVASNLTGRLRVSTRLNGAPSACYIYLVPNGHSADTVIMQGSDRDNGTSEFAHLPPGTYDAVAFEHPHAADYGDPATLAPYSAHVRSITIHAGDTATLDLDAVAAAEMVP